MSSDRGSSGDDGVESSVPSPACLEGASVLLPPPSPGFGRLAHQCVAAITTLDYYHRVPSFSEAAPEAMLFAARANDDALCDAPLSRRETAFALSQSVSRLSLASQRPTHPLITRTLVPQHLVRVGHTSKSMKRL